MDLPELNDVNTPPGTEMTSHTATYGEEEIRGYLERTGEPVDAYRRDGRLRVPPGLLLAQPIRIAHNNYRYETGVHVSSRMTLQQPALADETLTIAGHIGGLFERNGNKYVSLAVSISGEGGRPVATIDHVSIYKLKPRGA